MESLIFCLIASDVVRDDVLVVVASTDSRDGLRAVVVVVGWQKTSNVVSLGEGDETNLSLIRSVSIQHSTNNTQFSSQFPHVIPRETIPAPSPPPREKVPLTHTHSISILVSDVCEPFPPRQEGE